MSLEEQLKEARAEIDRLRCALAKQMVDDQDAQMCVAAILLHLGKPVTVTTDMILATNGAVMEANPTPDGKGFTFSAYHARRND